MKLFCFPRSHWSRTVSLTAAEAGIRVEPVFVDIRKNATYEPDYMRLNPRGVVPTLVDGDRVFWDSRRIAQQIDQVAGTDLWRADDPIAQDWIRRLHDFPLMLLSYSVWVLGKRGERSADILDDKIERAKAYAQRHPDLAQSYLRKAAFFEDFRTQVYDDAQVATAVADSQATIDEMGEHLSQRQWLAGDHYSFADCIATSMMYRLIDLELVDAWHRDESHGAAAYYRRVQERPSFRAVFVDDPLLATQ